MSCPNFKTMKDFPLIVAEEQYMKVCPKCKTGNCTDVCDECGEDLTDAETVYDYLANEEMSNSMQRWADKMNAAQAFYEVTLESGHYSGIQFYVDDKYYKVEELDNEDAQTEFGMCRSAMLRKYKVAGNTIRRMLKQAKKELGLMELEVAVRFSNGETWYDKVA